MPVKIPRSRLGRTAATAALALPLLGGGATLAAANTGTDEPTISEQVPVDDLLAAYDSYYGAGYTYEELMVLAEEWNLGQFEAKIAAGELIRSGDAATLESILAANPVPVPVDDGVDPAADAGDADADDVSSIDAFFAAGYDYDQAVELAADWGLADVYSAKVQAGTLVLDGRQAELDALLAEG